MSLVKSNQNDDWTEDVVVLTDDFFLLEKCLSVAIKTSGKHAENPRDTVYPTLYMSLYISSGKYLEAAAIPAKGNQKRRKIPPYM